MSVRGLGLGTAALLEALVVACTPSLAPPSVVIPLPENGFGQFELWVYGDSGLVTGGRANAAAARGAWELEVIAFPESNELEVAWMGGACSHRPVLGVTGDATSLRLELTPSPIEWTFFPQGCPAVGLFFSVTITLSAPVEQDAITAVEAP